MFDRIESWLRRAMGPHTKDGLLEMPGIRISDIGRVTEPTRYDLIDYQVGGGAIHAVIDAVHGSDVGEVHVICPADPEMGGMVNFVENIVEAITLKGGTTAALILHWAQREPAGPLDGPMHVTFGRVDHSRAKAHGRVAPDVRTAKVSDHSLTSFTAYRSDVYSDPNFKSVDRDALVGLLGPNLRLLNTGQVSALIAEHPHLSTALFDVQQRSAAGSTAFNAAMEEYMEDGE